jgi:hypothetical protein
MPAIAPEKSVNVVLMAAADAIASAWFWTWNPGAAGSAVVRRAMSVSRTSACGSLSPRASAPFISTCDSVCKRMPPATCVRASRCRYVSSGTITCRFGLLNPDAPSSGRTPNQPFVVERFRQGDEGRRDLRGHAGLGLAIARPLVALHDGDVAARNDPAGGAEPSVRLPRAYVRPP